MNLKQLEAFRAVMTTGSTIGAAALLDQSQSAVSRQITRLEDELGFALFERAKGRLVPRPEAEALRHRVEDLTHILAETHRLAEELKAGTGGQSLLKIAVAHSLATTLLPRIVETFLADRPQLSVEILSGPYPAIERMVATRQADLGLIRLPPEDASFHVREVFTSDTVCIVPRGHPLAALAVVSPRDLMGHDLVLLGRQRAARREIESVFRAAGAVMRCRIETHSVGSASAFVAQGLGVSMVTGVMARLFAWLPIEIRPFAPRLPNSYGVITLPAAPTSRAADAFVGCLVDGLGEEMV